METMQQGSPVLSVLEANLTSSFFQNQLECDLHLLLSPITVQLAFEMIQSPLDFAYTVVKPAFFVVLHLQDPSVQ